MADKTTPGGFLYDPVNGGRMDEPTAVNNEARWREVTTSAVAQAASSADRAEAAADAVYGEILGYVPATNLIRNGDFSRAFEGWNYHGSTATPIPGAVAATGTGAISGVGLYTAPGARFPAQPGHRLYVQARMRVRTPGATTMRVELVDGVSRLNAAEVKPPSLDLWTTVSGVAVVPESFAGREVQTYAVAYWPDGARAAGAVVEIDHVLVLDLTETYGAGHEPTAAETRTLVDAKGGWWDGTVENFARSGGGVEPRLSAVEARVSGVDDRVEALDARVGDGSGPDIEETIRRVLAEQSGDRVISATNLVPSPGYAAFPNGWKYQGSQSGAVSGSSVEVTGAGNISGVGIYSDRAMMGNLAGRKVYLRADFTTVDAPASLSVSLSNGSSHVYVNGTSASVNAPGAGRRVVSGVVTVPADWTGGSSMFQVAYYGTAANAAGKRVTLGPAVVLDLTEMYGAGHEPTAATVDALVAKVAQPMTTVPVFQTIPATDSAPDTVTAGPARRMGPPVIFRFDDGFVNNLTLAAPLLAKHGYSGTLYAATRPSEWAGASMPMMTPAQWKELHDRWGWEIGSHVTAHQDATVGDPAVWAERLRESCDDIVKAGLPWPRTVAYPNGSRNTTTDRYVARLFQVCGLTGHPSKIPVDRHARTFFTGWTTVDGLNPGPGIAQLKSYVRAATARGEVPILGFHGITEGAPPAAHHMSLATLTEIVEWLAAEGYSSMLMGDLLPQNLLADPGFEEHALGQFPWITSGGGWSRTRSTAVGHTGWYGADLLAGGAGLLYQTAPVDPGQTYRLRVRFGAGRTITGGRVDVVAIPQAPTGSPVGPTLTVGTMTEGPTEADVTGLVTVPAGASVLKVGVQPVGFTGSGVRVVHAALYRADLYDPLA